MAIVSRRWSRGVSAGASCLCGGEPSLSGETGHIEWVCPKCAASARVCDGANGSTPCVLVRGHGGDHESVDGFCWGRGRPEPPEVSKADIKETVDKVLAGIAVETTAAYQRGVADEAKDKARLVEESYQRGRREATAEVLSLLSERADVLGDQEAEALAKAAKLGEARRALAAMAARVDALAKGEG